MYVVLHTVCLVHRLPSIYVFLQIFDMNQAKSLYIYCTLEIHTWVCMYNTARLAGVNSWQFMKTHSLIAVVQMNRNKRCVSVV